MYGLDISGFSCVANADWGRSCESNSTTLPANCQSSLLLHLRMTDMLSPLGIKARYHIPALIRDDRELVSTNPTGDRKLSPSGLHLQNLIVLCGRPADVSPVRLGWNSIMRYSVAISRRPVPGAHEYSSARIAE